MRLMVLLGVLAVAGCQRVEPHSPEVANRPRYTVANSEGTMVLLDTVTGRTWEAVRLSDHHNRLVWAYVRRLDDAAAVKRFASEAKLPDVAVGSRSTAQP